MSTPTLLNIILDIILIVVSVWTVMTVRGMGGVIGRGLNLITIGIVILGVAHLISSVMRNTQLVPGMIVDPTIEPFIHRIIVLAGFLVLVLGFRQINTINR
jgi:hypothetical protein